MFDYLGFEDSKDGGKNHTANNNNAIIPIEGIVVPPFVLKQKVEPKIQGESKGRVIYYELFL